MASSQANSDEEAVDHLDLLAAALEGEREHQARDLADKRRLPLADRIAVGASWPPLRVEAVSPAGRGATRVVARPAPGVVLHDAIGEGDLVDVEPLGVTARVEASEPRAVELRVDADLDDANEITVTLRFDATTFDRYAAALRLGARSPVARALLTGDQEDLDRRTVEERTAQARALAGRRLNPTQLAAVDQALAATRLALIHGPPGTGKTETLAALLAALVASGDRPWALADSNAAVDHLASRAAAGGLEVVRIGRATRIGADVASLTVDARVAAGPYGEALARLDKALSRDRRDGALWAERRELAARAQRHVLDRAEVLALTFGTLARVARDLPRAHTAVVDEATQAIEPALWTAVPFVERLVLVGDPHQLGPVVTQPGNPLGRSAVDRLLRETALPMPMLGVQHRMAAEIQALVADVYGEGLVAHPTVAGRRLADLPGVADTALTRASALWVDTAGAGLAEELDPVTRSWHNPGEADLVVDAVRALRAAGVPADAIGVIAPYSAQVGRLAARLDVEVATVNAFQGREKEAIVCSFVRSNDDGDLGFVGDGRRLTVALTRARRLVVCVGDTATLCAHSRFSAVVDAIGAAGGYHSAWDPPWASED